MENEELERMTGKLIWLMLPPVVGLIVGLKVLDWMIRTYDEWRYWDIRNRASFKATMAMVDALMKANKHA